MAAQAYAARCRSRGVSRHAVNDLSPNVNKLPLGYTGRVTWGELIRRLKAAGFVEHRTAKGSHRQLVNPTTGTVITVSVHTKKEVGTGLAQRILKEAGL
jgi:predicted RNA binding protein YcfA (HicA-like mRNA interferase family)